MPDVAFDQAIVVKKIKRGDDIIFEFNRGSIIISKYFNCP